MNLSKPDGTADRLYQEHVKLKGKIPTDIENMKGKIGNFTLGMYILFTYSSWGRSAP